MLVDSPGEFAKQTYDFVIIGGGTSGLTLATWLTEDLRSLSAWLKLGRIVLPIQTS